MITPSEAAIAGRNIALLAESAAVIRILKSRGINPVIVKGAALLLSIYKNDFSKRPVSDIDLFVPPGRIEPAADALQKHGFVRMEGGESHYARPVSGERHGVIVDLHDILPYLSRNAYARMLRRAAPALLNNVETLVLDPRDELVYLIYHAAVQHGGMNPVWTEDLDRIIRRNSAAGDFDWEAAARFIRTHGFGLPAACFLEELRSLRGTSVPDEFIRNCHPPGTKNILCGIYRRLTRKEFVPDIGHILRFFALNGFGRIFYAARFAFASPSFASARYGSTSPLKTAFSVAARPVLVALKSLSLVRKIAYPD